MLVNYAVLSIKRLTDFNVNENSTEKQSFHQNNDSIMMGTVRGRQNFCTIRYLKEKTCGKKE